MKIEYPKWLYHRTAAPVIVQDPEEHAALGEEWADTPAAFVEDAPAPAKKPKKKR